MTFAVPFKTDIPSTAVHVRASGADAWTEQPYLYVDSLGYSIGGGFGRASLRYHYGRIKREDRSTYQSFQKLSIDRYYVRITYTPNTVGASVQYWYGIVISSIDKPLGSDNGNVSTFAGNQTFTAVTLDWLLTQRQITSSWIAEGSMEKQIMRGVTFNGGEGSARMRPDGTLPNRSQYPNGNGVFAFTEDLGFAEQWAAIDILQYLLAFFSPTDGAGPVWSINATVWAYLSWFRPLVVSSGRTVYDLINSLVDSKRGLAWWINVFEAGAAPNKIINCEINVATYSQAAITLTDANVIPANVPKDISLDGELHVTGSLRYTDSQQRYSQVSVTGARRGACFSIGIHDGTMVEDWTYDEEQRYKAGDPNAAGLDRSTLIAKHDAYRNSDAVRHVYTRFRLPDDWSGQAGNGTNFPMGNVCPIVQRFDGQVTGGGEPFWQSGIRFQKKLPLREFHDYGNSIESPDNNTPPNSNAAYVDTFAVISVGGPRVLTHLMQSWWNDEVSGSDGTAASSVVEIIDDAPALYVTPTTSPHANAFGDFDPAADLSDHDAIGEWRTMICTVFAEWDSLVEAVFPANPDPAINDLSSVLTIRFGGQARMDYVAAGTVLGVENDDLVIANQGGFTRNDHAMLRDVAKMAWLWYSVARHAIRLRISHITNEITIGNLVGSVDGDTVNSLVTSVRYDWVRGDTAIETQFANIDARRLV